MNEREHAVLSLFYDEGHREVTPSLLAYRMRMSTRDATKLLDGMVKDDTLNLNVDEEGHISYQLPPSERHRIGERRRQTGRNLDNSGRQPDPQSRDHSDTSRDHYGRQTRRSTPGGDGADATTGRGQRQPTQHHRSKHNPGVDSTRQRSTDGTDGSVGPTTGPVAGARPYRPEDRTWSDSSSSDDRTTTPEDWYVAPEDSGPATSGGHRRGHNPHRQSGPPTAHPPETQRTAQGQRQPGQHRAPDLQQGYGQTPDHRSLTPYQSSQLPAEADEAGPRRHRIPVLAGALSLLIPGLGQFYNGEIGKGVMLLFSYLFLWVFWLFWIVHIWSIIDAYMVAEHSSHQKLPDESGSSQPPLLPDQQHQNSNRNSSAA